MILHADINSCYASCEQVFNPKLLGRPVVVLSNNDGCVIARNAESKALGIEMGEPWHLRKDHFAALGVAALSSNYTLYGDMSRRVMDILRSYSERMEIYSIDEAFLEFHAGVDLLKLAREIRATIRRYTGLTVGIGVAPTKVLAKAANRVAKKNPAHGGVFVWPEEHAERTAILRGMTPSQVWGIARRQEAKLAALGITDAAALASMPEDIAHRALTVVGLRIVLELRGFSSICFDDVAPERKSLIVSRSFGHQVRTAEDLMESVSMHAETAGTKLRAQGLSAERIEVFIHTNPFRPDLPQHSATTGHTFDTPTNFAGELIRVARACAERMFIAGHSYKKAGVMLFGLRSAATTQLAFNSAPVADCDRRKRLMGAVDSLNRGMGRGTVRQGSVAAVARWHTRADRRSPRYTTRWDELPVAYAR